MPDQQTSSSPSFVAVADWREGGALIELEPFEPRDTLGLTLHGLRVFVRDHKQREVPLEQRELAADYGEGERRLVVTQARPGPAEARRKALDVRYGASPQPCTVAGREGRIYPLGPPVPDDDIDGRAPAVVVWCDEARLCLVASPCFEAGVLHRVAESMYAPRRKRQRSRR